MDLQALQRLLESLKTSEISVDDAIERLRHLPFEDVGPARVDHHRQLRTGMPEVIFGQGKTPDQIAIIALAMARRGTNVLVTRLDQEKTPRVLNAIAADPALALLDEPVWDPVGRTLVLRAQPFRDEGRGTIAIVCAGTSDLPVAQEARTTAELLGNRVELIVDVGVAGIHRLFAVKPRLDEAEVIIAVAGMEGALAGVVAGLVERPVIGVPTSIGYGTSFGGVSALLTMLNSCAAGLSVVNIDNGFGAACAAAQINRRREN